MYHSVTYQLEDRSCPLIIASSSIILAYAKTNWYHDHFCSSSLVLIFYSVTEVYIPLKRYYATTVQGTVTDTINYGLQ